MKIAINTGIVSKPGFKPDFGQGVSREQLTDWQRRTRYELTFKMQNVEATTSQIASVINQGGTVTAWHGGGADCRAGHECKHRQHRCNANFLTAQHLGADFDNLGSEAELFENPLVREYGSIIYHTPSSLPGKPKMRVIFLLDEEIDDGPTYRQMVKAMMWKFEGKPDPACSDYCRLFYGNFRCNPVVTGRVLPLAVALDWLADYDAAQPKAKPALTKLFTPESGEDSKRREAFGRAVLARACDKVRGAAQGNRHYELKRQAFNVGTFVAGGVLDEMTARQALEEAYRTHVANPPDMDALIDWAFDHARNSPQGLPVEAKQSRQEWWASRGYQYAV